MEEFLFFHDFAMTILAFILGLVGYMIGLSLVGRRVFTGLLEGQTIEGLWTALPAVVLVQIAIPSLLLLYSLDESAERQLSLKALGHQWYWSYEYSDFGVREQALEFDAYMLPASERQGPRLLEVDNRTVLP